MKKRFTILLFVFSLLTFKSAVAQDFNLLYDKLDDVLFNGNTDEVSEEINTLNLEGNNLSKTKKAIINYKIATYFEKKNRDVNKAILYYEKSLLDEPNYYVPHLAVGYLYLNRANDLRQKYNDEKDDKQKQLYILNYKKELSESVPHLEKAYACDPNEQVLKVLETIYTTLKTPEIFKTLNERVKILSQNCIEVLSGY